MLIDAMWSFYNNQSSNNLKQRNGEKTREADAIFYSYIVMYVCKYVWKVYIHILIKAEKGKKKSVLLLETLTHLYVTTQMFLTSTTLWTPKLLIKLLLTFVAGYDGAIQHVQNLE